MKTFNDLKIGDKIYICRYLQFVNSPYPLFTVDCCVIHSIDISLNGLVKIFKTRVDNNDEYVNDMANNTPHNIYIFKPNLGKPSFGAYYIKVTPKLQWQILSKHLRIRNRPYRYFNRSRRHDYI